MKRITVLVSVFTHDVVIFFTIIDVVDVVAGCV